MMSHYHLSPIKQLRNELLYAPEEVRRRQVERLERLYRDVKTDRDYAYEYVAYRVTGFRPSPNGYPVLPGKQLKRDLRTLLADLSNTVTFPAAEADEPILTIEDLTSRFQVSAKTISRWRKRGLINRRYVFPDGKVKVGFRRSAVDSFVEANGTQVDRGKRFTHMSDSERAQIIRRAKRLARVAPECFSEVTRRVARKLGRSAETIRYTIRNYDREHPDAPIFPDTSAPLSDLDRDLIYEAYVRGMSFRQLGRRFGRTRSTVYRIVKEMRARDLLAEKSEYVDSPEFHQAGSEGWILGQSLEELLPRPKGARGPRTPRDLPPYLQGLYRVPLLTKEQEVGLFRRYNYLKYRVATLKEGLDPATVKARDLRKVNDLRRQAMEVKNLLIQANLRLVVSIAKRHVGRMMNFFELVSDGNVSLMRAVEKFDYTKGNKFSTYASWAIIKNFARTIPEENYRLDRYVTGRDEVLDTSGDQRRQAAVEVDAAAGTRELVGKVLSRLTERERKVIMSRFGLGETAAPQKLEDVGRSLGVTKERIRQIEARALDKLRGMVDPETLELSSK
jgi:RNA polymerase primary sigma factor